MSVKLREQKNKEKTSLYLDISHKGKRWKEFLDLWVYNKPSADQKLMNKQVYALAEKNRSDREIEIMFKGAMRVDKNTLVSDYLTKYKEAYTKTDKSSVTGMVDAWSLAYPSFKMSELNNNVLNDFRNYLRNKFKPGTCRNYFGKLTDALQRAYFDKVTEYNVFTFKPESSFKEKGQPEKKDVLTPAEIKILISTETEYPGLKKGFITSLFTGLAFTDIFHLKFSHVKDKIITKHRQKTGVKATIPMHPDLAKLIGTGPDDEYIFDLPSRDKGITLCRMKCTYELDKWVTAAAIKKHITWHCARHSFGTNLKSNDLLLISRLMGWKSSSGPANAVRYVRVDEDEAREAVNKLKGF
jgi:integrase/recombinase XerD